jgi:hypothetical protein
MKPIILLILFVLGVGFMGRVWAAPRVHSCVMGDWIGGSGAWEDVGNWCGGVLPGPSAAVNIMTAGITITISSSQTVFGIGVAADGVTLENSGILTVNGFGVPNSFTLINSGTLTVANAFGAGNNLVITNGGTFTVGNAFGAVNNLVFTNQGKFTVAVLGTGNDARITNSGTFTVTTLSGFGTGSTFTNICHGVVTGVSGITMISQPCAPVGGVMTPVNRLGVLAPYLALIGAVAAVAVVIVKPWKKPVN